MSGKSIRVRGALLLAAAVALAPVSGPVSASADEDTPTLTITQSWKCPGDASYWACTGQEVHGMATLSLVETDSGVVPYLNCTAWNTTPFFWYGLGLYPLGTPTWNASLSCYVYDEDGLVWDEVYQTNYPSLLWLPETSYGAIEPTVPATDRLHLCFEVGGYYAEPHEIKRHGSDFTCGVTGGPDSIDESDLIPGPY